MYLSFDLGGTNIKAGIIDKMGNIISKRSLPTIESKNVEEIVMQFKEISNTILTEAKIEKKNIKGVGVGIPGYVDPDKGLVIKAANLDWVNINIKEKLEKVFEYPIFISNDANAAALGEMWKGAGKNYNNLLCLTLGTGVGAGVIIDGQVHNGCSGVAGEIGHFRVKMDSGRMCNCGQTGCLETESSASALVFYGMEKVNEGKQTILTEIMKREGQITAKDIAQAALKGDKVASEIINDAAHYLGLALANIYTVLAPQKIIIGGGLSAAGEILFEAIRASFDKFIFTDITGRKVIFPAELGNDAGMVGLGKLVDEGVNR